MHSLRHFDSCESAFLCRLARQTRVVGRSSSIWSRHSSQQINFCLCLPYCLHVFAEHPKWGGGEHNFRLLLFPVTQNQPWYEIAQIHFPPDRWRWSAFSDLQLPAELHSITQWHFCDLAQDSNDLAVPLSSSFYFFLRFFFFQGTASPPSQHELIDALGARPHVRGGWRQIHSQVSISTSNLFFVSQGRQISSFPFYFEDFSHLELIEFKVNEIFFSC